MRNKNNKNGNFEKISVNVEQEDLQIAGRDEEMPVVQNITETRIRKYKGLKYENVPTREIRKWFEARRI